MKLLATLLLASTCAYAQAQGGYFADFFNITTYPNQNKELAGSILKLARDTAGSDLWPFFIHRCIRGQSFPELNNAGQIDGFVTPSSPFKNVFFVGQAAWSAWAIDTGNRELVLIDTLVSREEAASIIIPGLEALGYSGSDIKWVIITHEHLDHYGGTRYLQEQFEPYVYASEKAWVTMANSTTEPPLYANYSKAVSVTDGETVSFNDFALTFYETPGHTPGTISMVFPVEDTDVANTPHIAGLYGGGGIPSTANAKAEQINSYNRFRELSKEQGVDVLIGNHQLQDNSLWHFDLLRFRTCEADGCNLPNPFVIGTEAYTRYLTVMGHCVALLAARSGQELPASNNSTVAARSIEFDHVCEG